MSQPGTASTPRGDRVLISVNPTTGRRRSRQWLDRLVAMAREHRLIVEVLTELNEVSALANQWHAEGSLRAVVGVGGDGTAAELVNRTAPGVPITMLPTGNENLLATYYHLSHRPEHVLRRLLRGRIICRDAAVASGRLFLIMASAGFDAEVVLRVHLRRQGRVGDFSYAKPILEAIRSYQYPELRVAWLPEGSEGSQGDPLSVSARWAFAFNIPRYGGTLPIAPKALATDGLLDLCTFRHGSLWHGLRYLTGVLLRCHAEMCDCVTGRTRRLRISSEAPVPYQLDGDPGGYLPVDIEVLPGRMTLLVPSSVCRDRCL